MSIILIPFGKGVGKFWLKAFIIVLIIFCAYFGYEFLIEGINNNAITNPLLIFLTWLLYPVYFVCFWCLKLVIKWGILSVIPIVIAIIIFSYILSFINGVVKRFKNK